MDRDQWPVWAPRRQGRADDSHPSRGTRGVGDDGERRRADIARPIALRDSARLPRQCLHGIAISGVGTTVVGSRSVTLLLPSRSATVRYGTPASKLVSRRSGARPGASWSSCRAPRQAHRSASRIGLVASGSSAKMCGPGKAPDQFARAFVRAGARTTPPPSRLAERRASLTRVGSHTRSTPGLPSMANANVHLFGLQVDIVDAKSEQLSTAISGPGGAWLHFWLHSHRVLHLGQPDAPPLPGLSRWRRRDSNPRTS